MNHIYILLASFAVLVFVNIPLHVLFNYQSHSELLITSHAVTPLQESYENFTNQ